MPKLLELLLLKGRIVTADTMSCQRKIALNLAKLEPSKGSMRGKLKRAGWNNAFLAQILTLFANLQMR